MEAKYILLQNGSEAVIDAEDFEKIKHLKWGYGYGGRYVGANLKGRGQVLLHRFIMNTPKGFHTDHINGNKLDNRKANLRICTPAQNQFNSRKHATSSSRFKGVSWFKRDECWRAYLVLNGRQKHLGYFKNESEAANAYNVAAQKAFGEYALLNAA